MDNANAGHASSRIPPGAPPSGTGAGRIVDGQGGEVSLRGMGLGGWMLQEGCMLGVNGDNPRHSIKARIADLVRLANGDRFYPL
jgi:hypothetical protein